MIATIGPDATMDAPVEGSTAAARDDKTSARTADSGPCHPIEDG
jgi:hypothetical protein